MFRVFLHIDQPIQVAFLSDQQQQERPTLWRDLHPCQTSLELRDADLFASTYGINHQRLMGGTGNAGSSCIFCGIPVHLHFVLLSVRMLVYQD